MSDRRRAYQDDERRSSHGLVRSGPGLPASGPVLATLSAELGSGIYQWTRYDPGAGKPKPLGPKSGKATEVNLTTGITANQNVLLYAACGKWWFENPTVQGSGGGGIGGWYGDGSDGAISLIPNPVTTDPASGRVALLGSLIGSTASGQAGTSYVLAWAIKGSSLDPNAVFASINPNYWYYFMVRNFYASSIDIADKCVLVPQGCLVCCSGVMQGPTQGPAPGTGYVSGDGNLAAIAENDAASQAFAYGGAAGIGSADTPGSRRGPAFGLYCGTGRRGGKGGINNAGVSGVAGGGPMDEMTGSGPLFSGAGGSSGGQIGGDGGGGAFPGGNAMHAFLAQAIPFADPNFAPFGGTSGGGGGASAGTGGRGGYGGAGLIVRAQTVGKNLKFTANGGDGFRGAAGNGGGGGGGNPSYVVVISDSVDASVTFSHTPGSGGAGIGGGGNGANAHGAGAHFVRTP